MVFKLEPLIPKIYDTADRVLMFLSFEMNMHLSDVQRTGPNLLDMLSAIGGIQSIVFTLFGLILSAVNFNHLENFMAQKLYMLQGE